MDTFIETLLDNLQQAVVPATPQGRLLYTNTNAQEWLGLREGSQLAEPRLTDALRNITSGTQALPHRLRLDSSSAFAGGRPLQVTFMWSAGGEHILMLFRDASPNAHLQSAKSIGELINQHCRLPMQRFFGAAGLAVEALSAHRGQEPELDSTLERAITRGRAVVDELSQLLAIAEAAEGRPIRNNERVEIAPLVREASQRAHETLLTQDTRLYVEGDEGELGAVYGSNLWLSRAIFEMLRAAGQCAERGSDMLVTLSANAGVVSIAVRVAGSTARVSSHEMSFTPFFQAREEGVFAPDLAIGLPFVRWVIESHGGHLRLTDDERGIAETTAEIPSGIAAEPVPCDAAAQTRRYAEDLTRLVRERDTSSR